MSTAAALTVGLGSAIAYGVASAGQHAVVHTGRTDARRLLGLVRDPRWLAASSGDVIGAVLQVVALGLGPVVLVQPLLVLALPVAVLARPWFGAARATGRDLGLGLLLCAGLAVFFAAAGNPTRGHAPGAAVSALLTAATVFLAVSTLAATRHRPPVTRALTFGVVAGCAFGVVSVLVEAVATQWYAHGLGVLVTAGGLVALLGAGGLAVAGYAVVQAGFQVGPLAASFPANLVLDPVVAVVLGAALLGERLPHDPLRLLGYGVSLIVLTLATVRLAAPSAPPAPGGQPAPSGAPGPAGPPAPPAPQRP